MDTFLNIEDFNQVCKVIGDQIEDISTLPRDKRVKRIKQMFEFQKVFSTDSVQGVAGILAIDTKVLKPSANSCSSSSPDKHIDTIKQQIVFKLSVEINRTIEHEFFVLKKLNALRSFCPNFVGALGLLPGYVTRSFFEEEEHDYTKNLFEIKKNPVQANYLLLEYVSDITFSHITKYADKATVTGILLGVLCALQVAVNKLNFVHYDLHSGNLLMRKIEEDAYFAYRFENEIVVYPTFGWYPVIIDMGSSYIKGIEERPTRTGIAHYHKGLQSTVFDKIGDLHHFMISACSRLEKREEQPDEFRRHFRLIAGRMMHAFRYGNIWRYNGWKQLPVNLAYYVNEAILKTQPELSDFYKKMRTAVIETMTLGVKLPWKKLTDEDLTKIKHFYYPDVNPAHDTISVLELLLKQSVEDVCHFLHLLDIDPLTKSDINILYALRTLVEHAALLPDHTSNSSAFSVSNDVINNFKNITQTMYPQYSYKMNFNKCFRGCAVMCIVFRHLLQVLNQGNLNQVKEWTEKAEYTKPIEIIRFLQQQTAVRFTYTNETPLYIWDSVKETHTKTTFGALQVPKELQRAQLEKYVFDRLK